MGSTPVERTRIFFQSMHVSLTEKSSLSSGKTVDVFSIIIAKSKN